MDQDVVETGGDHRPAVGNKPIDPVARARVDPLTHGQKCFDFQVLEPAIDCLPALASIARTKDPATERSDINRAVFPRGERQNKWIGHALARFRPVDAPVLTAKQTEAKRTGIDQIIPDRRERLNARALLTEGIVLRLVFSMARGLLRRWRDRRGRAIVSILSLCQIS